MRQIIKDGQVLEDLWTLVDDIGLFPPGKILIALSSWNEQQVQVSKRGDVGIWMESDELPEDIEGDIERIPVIAVKFPSFADGRGFSIGRLLRERYNYPGELRAIGAPIRDQLSYLVKCGFNAFELPEHYDPTSALESLSDFQESYQSSVDQQVPLFKRR